MVFTPNLLRCLSLVITFALCRCAMVVIIMSARGICGCLSARSPALNAISSVRSMTLAPALI